MSPPDERMPGRTPEERERARLEREARRAAQEQGREPAPPNVGRAPADRGPVSAPRQPAGNPGVPDPGAGADRDSPSGGGRRARGAAGSAGAGIESAVASARRIVASRREAFARRGEGAERDPDDRREGGALRRASSAPLVVAAVAVVAVLFAIMLFQPFKGAGEGEVGVSIPSGAGVGDIADILDERGVVSSAFFFELRARLGGGAGDLKSGDYTLREDMSYSAAIDELSGGPPEPEMVTATIPEGRARGEVAPVVAEFGLEGDYLKATESSKLLDPAKYGAEGADSLEGFLFPATYDLDAGASVDDLVAQQLETFDREISGVNLKRAKQANLTPYDVLTIASMVEREAQLPEERPIIASVIYNRLRDGMPLGIDATIRFATENWTEPLTESQLAVDSPYNTRTNAGLPPGPIGSPGVDSIEAAANPADTGFLFYVVKPGTCGEHAFSETDVEFQEDVDRYNAERAARGGQSPTDCPE